MEEFFNGVLGWSFVAYDCNLMDLSKIESERHMSWSASHSRIKVVNVLDVSLNLSSQIYPSELKKYQINANTNTILKLCSFLLLSTTILFYSSLSCKKLFWNTKQ